MNIAVRYYTRSGNTKKLAEAIGGALGVKAENVSVSLPENADLLFLGCSVYAGGCAPEVSQFIESNSDRIGKIAVFGSSASGKSTIKKIKAAAGKNGLEVCGREYICRGKFLFLNGGRPNEDDLAGAVAFADAVSGALE